MMTTPDAEPRASDSPARPGTWPRARWTRAARALAGVVAVLCVVVLAGAGTLRSTVLDRGFYQDVLDDERAYDRLYDEVLVDPQARPVTRSLLARLPVPESVVTANVKTVLPPATLRELTKEQIAAFVAYLRGDSGVLAVSVDLRPVLTNVDELAEVYLGELVAGPPGRPASGASARKRIAAALDDVAAGRRPARLPRVELSDRAVERVGTALLSGVPGRERAALRPQVEGALGAGDVATALAAVGPHLPGSTAGDGGKQGARELIRITEGGRWNVVEDLHGAGVHTGALESARTVTRLTLGPVQALAVLTGGLALGLVWLAGPPGRTRRLRTTGWILTAGGTVTALLSQVLRWTAGDLLTAAPRSWPPSLAALVEDLEAGALDTLAAAGLAAAWTPLALGALLVAGSFARQHRHAARKLSPRARTTLLGGLAAVTTTALVAGVTLAPSTTGSAGTRYCNGSARLCGLRYDQAAYLATHNAMSTTADRFINPLQDAGITAQLDHGARALLIDTHTWERRDQIAERLKLSESAPAVQRRITDVIDRTGPRRPGLWLCHALCRAGALPLVETLREIGTWLRAHPDEVVTLIIQDGVTGERTASAFEKAGLTRLLFTPDGDPHAPWPTLGEMTDDGRRLVVFAENSQGPPAWYRNYYRYGMETPYAFTTPEDMTCVPHRGGSGKPLFLLNHFITSPSGSRTDAGEVNAAGFVLDRARRCAAERGRPVNFIAVDYANLGDAKTAVDILNTARTR